MRSLPLAALVLLTWLPIASADYLDWVPAVWQIEDPRGDAGIVREGTVSGRPVAYVASPASDILSIGFGENSTHFLTSVQFADPLSPTTAGAGLWTIIDFILDFPNKEDRSLSVFVWSEASAPGKYYACVEMGMCDHSPQAGAYYDSTDRTIVGWYEWDSVSEVAEGIPEGTLITKPYAMAAEHACSVTCFFDPERQVWGVDYAPHSGQSALGRGAPYAVQWSTPTDDYLRPGELPLGKAATTAQPSSARAPSDDSATSALTVPIVAAGLGIAALAIGRGKR